MNLGIGAGVLGTALGQRLSEAGHAIIYGTGAAANPEAAPEGADVGSNAEAAEFADVVVLATPFAAVEQALRAAGDLGGQILWSCVNALKHDLSGLAVGFDSSAEEHVARLAPGARVVAGIPPFARAIASGSLAYDQGPPPSVFLAGDDAHGKHAVERLVRDLGATPEDAGPLTSARYIEPATMLAVTLAYAGEPRDLGLPLLER